jgi:sugar lactone lactonase YvrE
MAAQAQTNYEPYTFRTFAGLAPGSTDGAGSEARFREPSGVAADSAGNVYVADTTNDTIRKITPDGVVSTLAGLAGTTGSADGMGSGARFRAPVGVVVDTAANVYVADTANHTIRKITPTGMVTTLAGRPGSSGSTDGVGSTAQFRAPSHLAIDSTGSIYVADSGNHTIRKITPAGIVSTIAGLAGNSGSNDGTVSVARFNYPTGLAVDTSLNVYVADFYNQTIRKVTVDGMVSTLAGLAGSLGANDGTGSEARFSNPNGVAVNSGGSLMVADTGNHTIRKITPAGVVSTFAGLAGSSGSVNGIGSEARFFAPVGVAVDVADKIYVAEDRNHIIRKITPQREVSTLAGLACGEGSADGTGNVARFRLPFSVAVAGAGLVYVADWGNNTIRKIVTAGVVSTFAGLAGSQGSNDGTGSEARFNTVHSVTVDGAGNVYVADGASHTIRKITPDGVVSTLAGLAGTPGSVDGVGSEARFNSVQGVAADSAGNVYVADAGNSTIRKVTPARVVTTVAGLAGNQGVIDGTGSEARFHSPSGGTVDSVGNLYVAEFFKCTIRKITPAGVVSTIAGVAGQFGHADGTGSSARFNNPADVAVDSVDNLYVADWSNGSIRKITAAGVVTTLGGSAVSFGSDDGAGISARFWGPMGVAVDSSGKVYVADTDNHTIRVGVPRPAVAGNISTRLRVGTGDEVLIGGFIITGTQPKRVIMRAIGPSLTPLGVPGALMDPTLELHGSSGQIIASNDDWMNAPNRQEIIDSGLAPTHNKESAILTALSPGAYTASVGGVSNTSGVGLVEAYDLDRTVDSTLANISTRGLVQTGNNVLIGGTIFVGSAPARVILRAIGPSLGNAGVPNPFQDPTLELHDGNGALIASNDDWHRSSRRVSRRRTMLNRQSSGPLPPQPTLPSCEEKVGRQVSDSLKSIS